MLLRRIGLAAAVVTLAGTLPAAQNGQPAQAVQIIQLQHGHPFQGDIRDLPHGLPPQHEKTPKGEEPALGPDHGDGDSASQNVPGSAPTPPPGSGGGAGNFAGLDFQNFGAGWPPDTNGDVGPTYFIQTVNTSVGIFRKSDGTRVTAFNFNTLMGQGNFGNACDNLNSGDPVVVYDSGADRWIISDFAFATSAGNPVAPYFECFAVSRTGDPVSGGWYFYALQTNDLFPDYPKLGVWPDGLYLTANMFSSSFKNVRVWALNKAQMYAGVAPTALMFNLPSRVGNAAVFTAIPSTYHTATGVPPAGRPNLIASIWSAKVARVWKFHADFVTPANSTVTGPSNVTLASWTTAPTSAPARNGNGLDTLYERLMVQNQYTNLAGTESLWLTHTVANPGNTSLTAPRWYQLNVTGGTVVTSGPLQQSTFAPDTAVGRWMPSLAVDKNGDMAIGYSAASSTLFPAIRYAGRLSTDPVNTLGQSETSLIEGTASQCCTFSDGTLNNRWGDYSAMTIDPDGCTFWYTNEFYQSPQPTTLAGDNWQTRIGSFKFASCTPNFATLQGTVTDSVTNAPISGATVTAGASSTNTDANGQYTLASLVAGTYNVTVSAQGYNSSNASVTVFAGVTSTQNFSLVASSGTATSLAVATASGTYGGTTTLSATLTAGGNGVSGKTIAFTLNGNAVGSTSTNGSGVAALLNVSLVGIGTGTYPTGVSAAFAGDASFGPSNGANALTITQASQTIAFGALADKTYGDPTFTVSATASSGLTVSFAASGNCSVTGTTVSITGAGSCTITASQAGDANYLPATNVPQTFSIAKASQTITFSALPSKTYGDPAFTVSATATSNLTVSFAASGNCSVGGTTVSITGAGSCTITASQAGDTNYLAATNVPQTFSIAKATQTITFNALSGKTYGDPSFAVSASASSGLAVSFGASGNCTVSGATVSITGAGSCTITASQAGNANYLAAANVPQTFSIAQASQTITFNALPGKTYGDPSFTVSATASSGLAVGFGASGNCTIAGTTVSITGAGSCTITASQGGNANYLAATNVPQTFSIAKANQIITFNALPDKTTSDPPFAVSATTTSGLPVGFGATGNCTISGNTVTITGAGSCTITASQPGNANFNAAVNVARSFNITSGGVSGATATFTGVDAITQGTWKGAYGAQAYTVVGDSASWPAWATVTPAGQAQYQFAASTSDVRGLQQGSGGGRVAYVWYADTWTLDVNITDGAAHQLALYLVDWDTTTRAQRMEVRDAASSALLDLQNASSFNGGQYWAWRVTGHVTITLVKTAGFNAVVSGVFLDSVGTPPTVSLTGPADQSTYTAPASIPLAANATDSDGVAKVEFYATPAGGVPTLIGAPVTSAPYQVTWSNVGVGTYTLTAKAYDIFGATAISAPVQVTVSGVGSPGTSATFAGVDSTTQGNWKGLYGTQAYTVVGDTTSWPAWATVTPAGQGQYQFAASTSDVRGLQQANGSSRVAYVWYADSWTLDVNITDGNAHQLALYLVDWDTTTRAQRMEIRDAVTGTLLDVQNASSYNGGQYWNWRVSGHVTITLIKTAGWNAVVSGVFLDGVAAP